MSIAILLSTSALARRVLIPLVCGAAVQVALAWALTLRSPSLTTTRMEAGARSLFGTGFRYERDVAFPPAVPATWPDRAAIVLRFNAFGYERTRYSVTDQGGRQLFYRESSAGWPMRSLETRAGGEMFWGVDGPTGGFVVPFGPVSRGIALSSIWNEWGVRGTPTLPARPVPLGFTVNTLVFALPWWCLMLSRRQRPSPKR
ncbi:MAG: hypothetical protein AAGH64_08870 [Planctomycetota bacterium]